MIIVIGIVVVLIAILLPTGAKAWRAAYRTRCMSNMRQVTQGYFAYVAANEGQLPDCDMDSIIAGKAIDTLVDLPYLRPYLNSATVQHCSEDSRGSYRSYTVNDYLGGEWLTITHARRLDRVKNAPTTLLLIEETLPEDLAKTSGGFVILGAPLPVWVSRPALLHEKGTCLCMADGHVEYRRWVDPRTQHLPATPYFRTTNNADLVYLQGIAGSVNTPGN